MPPDYFNAKTRSREFLPRSGSFRSTVEQRGNLPFGGGPFHTIVQDVSGEWKAGGKQVTVSEGHPFRGDKHRDDVGGPFDTSKQIIGGIPTTEIHYSVPMGILDWEREFSYSGPVLPIAPPGSPDAIFAFPPSFESSDDDLDEMGTTAISLVDPGNPIMSLSTTLGELYSEGLPKLVSSDTWVNRTSVAQKAGSNYLNAEFGWLPLVSDVRQFVDIVNRAGAVIKQYKRDAGRRVRRRYYFPSVSSVDTTFSSSGVNPWVPGGGANFVADAGTLTRVTQKSRRAWFSGAFTYTLPPSIGELDNVRLLTHLLGADPSPETLWNLAPWSWAADWFTNAGSVIQNISSFQADGHVLAYGYMMEESSVTDTYSLTGCHLTNGQPLEIPALTLTTTVKKRRKANPYGFGVHWEELSPFRLSILAALGITRHGR